VLAEIGVALYGEQWKAPRPDALGLRRDHLRYWLRGRMGMQLDHPAFDRAAKLLAPASRVAHRNAAAVAGVR
jgi:hypothetical protein